MSVHPVIDPVIRPFVDADLAPAAALLRRAALDFILHESTLEGARDFLARHGEDGLRANIAAGFVYHAALADGELAGFIGLRERSHVFHLFVDERWQRRGIARRLWETARDVALESAQESASGARHPGVFTVNASNHALPFYESLGFVRTAPMQVAAVLYNPMKLDLGPAADSVFVAPA
jgi:GNAT superfamily N-acetyltransferase